MSVRNLNYSEIIHNILGIDKLITCAIIAKINDGRILASKYRDDESMPLLTTKESELSVIQSLIRMSMRRSLEYKFGKTVYASTVYENVTRASMYVFNDGRKRKEEDELILMISFDKNADHEQIINSKILPFLNEMCRMLSPSTSAAC